MKKLFLILLSIIMICLVGCGNKEDEQSAEAVFTDFISSFQSQDFKHMYALTADNAPYYENAYNPDQALNVALFKALGSNMEYDITKIEVKGDEANIFYHLRTLDSEKLMQGIVQAVTKNPNEDVNEMMRKQIVLCPRLEKDTVINMHRSGDSWSIESNVGIYDDLSGGFLQFIYNSSLVK